MLSLISMIFRYIINSVRTSNDPPTGHLVAQKLFRHTQLLGETLDRLPGLPALILVKPFPHSGWSIRYCNQ